jgi:2-oxoglutarate dehydrogenase E1 component
MAFEYRQEFRGVVIDKVCYRRRVTTGRRPLMTQPVIYSLIEGKGTVRQLNTEAPDPAGGHHAGAVRRRSSTLPAQHDNLYRRRGRNRPASTQENFKGLEVPESQQETRAS